MNELIKTLSSEFNDKEYAHAYMESHAVSRIAAQIYALRKQRNLSQEQLSALTGIPQEKISKIESADFESVTMKTLQKFSRAFDINLKISYESFSEGIKDIVNLTKDVLEVKSRVEDLQEFNSSITKTKSELKIIFADLGAPIHLIGSHPVVATTKVFGQKPKLEFLHDQTIERRTAPRVVNG